MTDSLRTFDIVRVRAGEQGAATDRAATEEPLEVRLHGRPFAVIMRTPGADRELAAGFLFAERVLRSADDLGTIEYCTSIDPRSVSGHALPNDRSAPQAAQPVDNVVNVTLTDDRHLERAFAERRQVTTNASCGLCGRRTIESLRADAPPLASGCAVTAAVLVGLPDRLRAAQTVFAETGGLHAAGLFGPAGELEQLAEDVGRHNAVDKVIGRLLMREELPLANRLLFVSGRASFEIVQKAFLAGIPIVAAVSAPSSLAIESAGECGMTLVGFLRGNSFNIYTHPHRVIG
jgi:FdhD protein